ncbi:MAG: hypothetical protein AB7K09_15530 [Planctomycetota bacterium]
MRSPLALVIAVIIVAPFANACGGNAGAGTSAMGGATPEEAFEHSRVAVVTNDIGGLLDNLTAANRKHAVGSMVASMYMATGLALDADKAAKDAAAFTALVAPFGVKLGSVQEVATASMRGNPEQFVAGVADCRALGVALFDSFRGKHQRGLEVMVGTSLPWCHPNRAADGKASGPAVISGETAKLTLEYPEYKWNEKVTLPASTIGVAFERVDGRWLISEPVDLAP